MKKNWFTFLLIAVLAVMVLNYFVAPLKAAIDEASCKSGDCRCSCKGAECTCDASGGTCLCNCLIGGGSSCGMDPEQ
jgi:hypothetical protein